MISSDDWHELALIRDQLRAAHDLLREVSVDGSAGAERLTAVDAHLESAAIGLEFLAPDDHVAPTEVIDLTARIRDRDLRSINGHAAPRPATD